ncbi:hypothetical protein HY439_00380 [Candidatus Microgenomates bacterium]|nr:hypothetical protein [Candidatus Microgenomates bacterium]
MSQEVDLSKIGRHPRVDNDGPEFTIVTPTVSGAYRFWCFKKERTPGGELKANLKETYRENNEGRFMTEDPGDQDDFGPLIEMQRSARVRTPVGLTSEKI